MPFSFPNWKFPVLNYLLGTSRRSNKVSKSDNSSSLTSSKSSSTLTSSDSSSDLSTHSITEATDKGHSLTRPSSPSSSDHWGDAPGDFTRNTISLHQGRETFTLPHHPNSFYVHNPHNRTVTRYDEIDDGHVFPGEEIPVNLFRESIITAVPSESRLSSRPSTSTSQSPKIAVRSQKRPLIEKDEDKVRTREIVATEINSLSEEEHQKITELVKKHEPEGRLKMARFYLMGDFLDKLKKKEIQEKYPELQNKDFRQEVATRMASKAIQEEQKKQLTIREKKREETKRSSFFGRFSRARTSKKI